MEESIGIKADIKRAKNYLELMDIVEQHGGFMTQDVARATFKQLHPEITEVSDEELNSVTGGAVDVSKHRNCAFWQCMHCGKTCAELGEYGVHECPGIERVFVECTCCKNINHATSSCRKLVF